MNQKGCEYAIRIDYQITVGIFIALLFIYFGFSYYTGIDGDDLEKYVTEYIEQDCAAIDEIRLGTTEVALYQWDEEQITYVVFEKMALLNRYHLSCPLNGSGWPIGSL